MEISQHSKYTCSFCGKDAVKRASVGIWHCSACKKTVAGGAYTLGTAQAAQVPNAPRRKSRAPAPNAERPRTPRRLPRGRRGRLRSLSSPAPALTLSALVARLACRCARRSGACVRAPTCKPALARCA